MHAAEKRLHPEQRIGFHLGGAMRGLRALCAVLGTASAFSVNDRAEIETASAESEAGFFPPGAVRVPFGPLIKAERPFAGAPFSLQNTAFESVDVYRRFSFRSAVPSLPANNEATAHSTRSPGRSNGNADRTITISGVS